MIELSENITSYISKNFGGNYLEKYKEYFYGDYRPYMRISTFADAQNLIEKLKRYEIELEKIDGMQNAYRILGGENIAGKTLEFILGQYYLQSLSSMIPALVLNPNEQDTVLDMCAAPGSKTTQLAELMNNKGTLIANEISLERMKSLVFNIDKMNLVNIGVMKNKGELLGKIFDSRFDKILVDAPCSALGIVQKKGEVSNWWNEKKAQGIAEIQYKLLTSAVKMCKVGGEITYSTCTITLEENEFVLDKILKKYPVELVEIDLPVKSKEAFTKIGDSELNPQISRARRIVPWEIGSEGFFVAKLRKIDESDSPEKYPRKEKKLELLKSYSGKIKNVIAQISEYYGIERDLFDNYKYMFKQEDIYFVDKDWESDNLEMFMRIGSKLGSIDKRQNVQLHTLAAQTFGSYAKRNMIQLENVKELESYFGGATLKGNYEAGQKIVLHGNYILGTATASQDGLKSQFPRAFRTQEIVLK